MRTKTPLTLCLLALTPMVACERGTMLNYEVYRAAPGEDGLELVGRACFEVSAGSGAGGGANEFAQQLESLDDGGVRLTYLLPDAPHHPEDPIDDSDPNLDVGAIVTLSEDELASGQSFTVEFDRADGAHFEAVHWGSSDCEL